jgi:hypothetical protein
MISNLLNATLYETVPRSQPREPRVQAMSRQPQWAPDGEPVLYERHRPEQTTLYRLVQQHAATFIAETEAATGAGVPQFVKDEFDALLKCGILAHGFMRLRCDDCGHDKLVAFSCKRRGFCPSCGARRMAQTAAQLVDHVIPQVPVRQWVMSLPIPLRLLLTLLDDHLDWPAAIDVRTSIQRVAQHILDEAHRRQLPAQLEAVTPRQTDFEQTLCADNSGFSPHAAVRCTADERRALEQLCCYITRPALANERVQTNAAGQVVLKLKTPWCDCTTHLVMSPLEFMQRLAALVPRPKLHLIRFHAVLAPNAKLRAMVVPQELEPSAQEAKPAECEASCVHHRSVRLSWAPLLKRVFELNLEHCPKCGGELKIIAAILEQPVIEKILTHLGLQARAPPRAPARGSQLHAA